MHKDNYWGLWIVDVNSRIKPTWCHNIKKWICQALKLDSNVNIKMLINWNLWGAFDKSFSQSTVWEQLVHYVGEKEHIPGQTTHIIWLTVLHVLYCAVHNVHPKCCVFQSANGCSTCGLLVQIVCKLIKCIKNIESLSIK